MRVKRYNSIIVADKVLSEFKKIARKTTSTQPYEGFCMIDLYSNCREQGYSITRLFDASRATQCVFAENRNSDSIVVYTGRSSVDFDLSSQIPSEKIYAKRHYFNRNEHKQAAQYVFDKLTVKEIT
tara:strand:- start:303 stop:680 length:378 start_codon:yes stop_codon:yes gene_type:complete